MTRNNYMSSRTTQSRKMNTRRTSKPIITQKTYKFVSKCREKNMPKPVKFQMWNHIWNKNNLFPHLKKKTKVEATRLKEQFNKKIKNYAYAWQSYAMTAQYSIPSSHYISHYTRFNRDQPTKDRTTHKSDKHMSTPRKLE